MIWLLNLSKLTVFIKFPIVRWASFPTYSPSWISKLYIRKFLSTISSKTGKSCNETPRKILRSWPEFDTNSVSYLKVWESKSLCPFMYMVMYGSLSLLDERQFTCVCLVSVRVRQNPDIPLGYFSAKQQNSNVSFNLNLHFMFWSSWLGTLHHNIKFFFFSLIVIKSVLAQSKWDFSNKALFSWALKYRYSPVSLFRRTNPRAMLILAAESSLLKTSSSFSLAMLVPNLEIWNLKP